MSSTQSKKLDLIFEYQRQSHIAQCSLTHAILSAVAEDREANERNINRYTECSDKLRELRDAYERLK